MATIPAARRWNAPRQLRLTRAGSAWIWLPSLVYVLILALNATAALTPPRLSLTLSVPATGHARVTWVMPGGALWDRGVRAGDAVLALNGRPPVRGDAGAWSGRRLRMRTEHGATVEVNAVTLPAGRATWPLLLLSPLFLLLATLVVLRAPRRAVGRATYLLFASAAYALALAPGADADNVAATVAEWAATAVFAAGFVHFFRVYPPARGTPRPRACLFVPPLAGVLLGVAALGWPPLYTLADLARITTLLAYLLLGAALLIRSFITVRADGARGGLTIICAGTVVSILPFTALYLLPTILGRPPLAAAEGAILALALLPVAFTYAILRHNALDVHLLQRWLVHGLLWVALLAPLTVAVFVRHRIFDAIPEPGRSVIFAAALALLTGLSFGWARVRLQRALDHLIFKDSYDYRASLQDLSRELSLAGDLDTLGAQLPATLRRLMNLDFAALLVHDDARGVHVRGDAGIDKPALLPALGAAAADVRDGPRAVSLEYGYLTVLVVPLRTHDVLVGHLCLGPKATGEPFRAEDRALLATLSGHLAAIVRNAHLVDDLRGQARTLNALNERLSRTQEEERARLAADLHDEPLQTALSLQRQIAIDGRDGPPHRHQSKPDRATARPLRRHAAARPGPSRSACGPRPVGA